MSFLKSMLFIGTALFVGGVFADSGKPSAIQTDGIKEIQGIIRLYSASAGVQAKVKKTMTLDLLGETKNSEGYVYFSKGKVRLEIDRPEKSIMVLGTDSIWLVTPPNKNLNTKTIVTKIKSQSLTKKEKAPLAVMLGDAEAWGQMKVIADKKTSSGRDLTLHPRNPKALGEIVEVQVLMNAAEKKIDVLSYEDDLGNKTKFQFFDLQLDARIGEDKFRYLPPADAEITILE